MPEGVGYPTIAGSGPQLPRKRAGAGADTILASLAPPSRDTPTASAITVLRMLESGKSIQWIAKKLDMTKAEIIAVIESLASGGLSPAAR